jgi:small subunit ribosomal protein S20
MPVTKSAIKAMKQANAAKDRNRAVKADFRGKVKAVKKEVTAGGKDLEVLTSKAIQAIDKAAKKGVIHTKAADRRKSRLMLALNKALGKVVVPASVKEKTEKAQKKAKKSTKKEA